MTVLTVMVTAVLIHACKGNENQHKTKMTETIECTLSKHFEQCPFANYRQHLSGSYVELTVKN